MRSRTLYRLSLLSWSVLFAGQAVMPQTFAAKGEQADIQQPDAADKGDTEDASTSESAAGSAEEDEAAIPLAGHSEHGEAYNEGPRQNAYLMGNTGIVDFPLTTNSDLAKKFFDQGLGQLYGFWYYEAERSFRRVASLDPTCAMAYWGMARANDENKDRAKSFIAEAVDRLEGVTEREQMYIEALEKYLTDEREEKKVRNDYTKALEKIIRKFPDDIEAKAMLAVHLWQSSRHGVPMNSHQAVDSLLGDVFRVQPMHSAHHFRIHLWDNEEPSQALESAAKCGPAAASIAHMWHMPGHIYSRLNRFHDAVYQQEASARVDHAHMMRDGVLPDQIHNYAHNNEWLIRNLVHLGRRDEALDLAKNMLELPRHPKYNSFDKDGMCSCKYGRRRLLQVLESFEMWDEILELADTMYLEPTTDREEQGKRWRMLGLAHYRRGESSQVKACLVALDELLAELDEAAVAAGNNAAEEKLAEMELAILKAGKDVARSSKDTVGETKSNSERREDVNDSGDEQSEREEAQSENGTQSGNGAEMTAEDKCQEIEKARKEADRKTRRGEKSIKHAIAELKGLQFLSRGQTDEAIEQFKESDIPKSRLAGYYFLAGDHKKAQELCKQAVENGENQVRPLAVQVDLLRRMKKADKAEAAFSKLRTVAGWADLNTPLLSKLDRFAKELDWPADWRTPKKPSDDVGDRRALETLGRFRWGPTAAESWQLKDPKNQTISLADYRGRPVVVIFYLGAGCLHCVEQLHEFAPRLKDFRKMNVDVVAISTETTGELAAAVKDFSKENVFPIRLVANHQLDVFKKYRAYDDFEEMPLHGTFLIDGQGMIRWHDISYEPFLEVDFLLAETKRLLSLDEIPSVSPATLPSTAVEPSENKTTLKTVEPVDAGS